LKGRFHGRSIYDTEKVEAASPGSGGAKAHSRIQQEADRAGQKEPAAAIMV
jgi:hypothetical protein